MNELRKFVIFPLGKRHYAVPASQVSELSMSASVQHFPHTTPSLPGVLLRRGQVVGVCDVASALDVAAGERKLFLIANCSVQGRTEPVAVPVTGECILADAVITSGLPAEQFSLGSLALTGETVSVLDLDSLIAYCTQGEGARATELRR